MNLAAERKEYELHPAPCEICDGPMPFMRWRTGKRTCGEYCASKLRILVRERNRKKLELPDVDLSEYPAAIGVDRTRLKVLRSALRALLAIMRTQVKCQKGNSQSLLSRAVTATKLLMETERLLDLL